MEGYVSDTADRKGRAARTGRGSGGPGPAGAERAAGAAGPRADGGRGASGISDVPAAGADRDRKAPVHNPLGGSEQGRMRHHEFQRGQGREPGERAGELQAHRRGAGLPGGGHGGVPPDPHHQHPPHDLGGQGQGHPAPPGLRGRGRDGDG